MIVIIYDDPVLQSFFPPQGKGKIVHLSNETQKILESSKPSWVSILDEQWPKENPGERELTDDEIGFLLSIVGLFDISPTLVVVLSVKRKSAFLRYAITYLRSIDEEDRFDIVIDSFIPQKSTEKNIFFFKEVDDESDINFPFVRYITKDGGPNKSFRFESN